MFIICFRRRHFPPLRRRRNKATLVSSVSSPSRLYFISRGYTRSAPMSPKWIFGAILPQKYTIYNFFSLLYLREIITAKHYCIEFWCFLRMFTSYLCYETLIWHLIDVNPFVPSNSAIFYPIIDIIIPKTWIIDIIIPKTWTEYVSYS